jgi:cupin fold WbuC family metalloprotein
MKIFTRTLLNELYRRADESPRRRKNHNVHETPDDTVQRMFNAVKRDSYIRPHRHKDKWEFGLIVRGKIDLLLFDGTGRVTARTAYSPHAENFGFEVEPGVWHTWISMQDDSVFFELKPGPYDPKSAVEFAPWAPAEGEGIVKNFLEKLRNAAVGETA